MLAPTHDLVRHDSGDVLGGRLPSDPDERADAVQDLLDRAEQRWCLGRLRGQMDAAMAQLVGDCTTPGGNHRSQDVCLRLSPTTLTITVAGSSCDLPLGRHPRVRPAA